MSNKVTVSSTQKDLHGDTLSLEHLKKGVETINGDKKMRMLINHRRDLPPIGYWTNGELDELSDVYLLKAEPILYKRREILTGTTVLIKESFETPVTFIERPYEEGQPVTLTFDKNNFESWDSVKRVIQKLTIESGEPIQVKHDSRKDLTPDPRLIITLTTYYSILYPLIKPFIKKIGEKIAEDIADDVYKKTKEKSKHFFKNIKHYITTIRKSALPKDKKLTTIFEIPGEPYIELHAKTDDADLIVNALNGSKISKLHQQLSDLSKLIDIKEVHFKLNEKGQWKFTYLIGFDGSIIGTKDIISKRDYLQNRINLKSIKGFSLGADVSYSDIIEEAD